MMTSNDVYNYLGIARKMAVTAILERFNQVEGNTIKFDRLVSILNNETFSEALCDSVSISENRRFVQFHVRWWEEAGDYEWVFPEEIVTDDLVYLVDVIDESLSEESDTQ